MIEDGPIPAVHGVVRWRLVDLMQWLWEEYEITISKQTLSREVRALDYRKLSARPASCPIGWRDGRFKKYFHPPVAVETGLAQDRSGGSGRKLSGGEPVKHGPWLMRTRVVTPQGDPG